VAFLDDHYLLSSAAARGLYAEVERLPIIDPHNHADPAEIVENRNWPDLWQVEGATDHYVWELMRRRGVAEERITGPAPPEDKWLALASCLPELIGNPTYEWIHLDLQRRFGIRELVGPETGRLIWEEANRRLATPQMRPQAVLEDMGVEILCTTDDPCLSLPHHERAGEAVPFTSVLPTWRPDKIMLVARRDWLDQVKRLGEQTGEDVSRLDGLLRALAATHRYFRRLGCRASDHGLSQPVTADVPESQAALIHERRWSGVLPSPEEVLRYQAFMLDRFAELDQEAGWVMQLHVGAVRDYRDSLWKALGPDSGGDVSTQNLDLVAGLRHLLNRFDQRLKFVLYALDPTHLPSVATLARAFPNLQVGAAWWFNDSPFGMEMQLKYLATVDVLANHAGMVTDSRKLISFGSRTEMFRRVLCQVVGEMVERGQAPEGPALDLVRNLCYHRPYSLFFG
jgi:glucuronate isomerase